MTYGWAILIIAVVLGALFQLGVFNPNSFAPKAQPGSCQVIRPYGVKNTNYISLAGTCNGQLPQYVATASGTSKITLPNNPLSTSGVQALSVSYWIYIKSVPAIWQTVFGYNNGHNYLIWLDSTNAYGARVYEGATNYDSIASGLKLNSWTNIVFTAQTGGNELQYINGQAVSASIKALPVGTIVVNSIPILIGGGQAGGTPWFTGSIANIQVYNSSLSANAVSALYDEGIGAAPIDLFSLAGWWPLNGNANDYSGNLNNGAATNVIYSGSWAGTYTPP